MPRVITDVHLPNPRHVEIGLTSRIQGWENQSEDEIFTGSLIDRGVPDRGCRYAQRYISAGEPPHNQLSLGSRDIEEEANH
jgi:hypothetical protein